MVLPLALFSLRISVSGPALVLPFISLAFLLACNAEPTAAPGANDPTAEATAEVPPTEARPIAGTFPPSPTAMRPAATAQGIAASFPVPTSTPPPVPGAALKPLPPATPTSSPVLIPAPAAITAPAATVAPGSTSTGPTATAVPAPAPAATLTVTPVTPMPTPETSSTLWRGLIVTPEDRCSPYDPDDYSYSPSVEPRIVDAQGGVYGPYTGTWFDSIRETDIEHTVARSEAHDSGLCAASPDTKDRFTSDLLNLALASPSVNRHQKSDKDAAEWLPALNQCWYVARILEVRRQYELTIDRPEAGAIDGVLAGCTSTEMVVLSQGQSVATATPTPASDLDALALYDDNGNGKITYAEARAPGLPVQARRGRRRRRLRMGRNERQRVLCSAAGPTSSQICEACPLFAYRRTTEPRGYMRPGESRAFSCMN